MEIASVRVTTSHLSLCDHIIELQIPKAGNSETLMKMIEEKVSNYSSSYDATFDFLSKDHLQLLFPLHEESE